MMDVRTGFEPITPDSNSGMLAVTPPDNAGQPDLKP